MAKSILDYTAEQVNTSVGNATKVRANQPLSGTEANLTALEVSGVNYKVPEGGGGGTDPALESAKATGGIGYKTITQNITWNGDITGKVSIIDGEYYQVSTTVADISEYASGKITMIYEEESEEYDIEETGGVQPMFTNLYSLCEDSILIATADVEIGGMSIPKGIYFEGRLEEETSQCFVYVSKLECGTTNKINSQYITRDELLANAIKSQGIGYIEDPYVITWDGDTTGKAVCLEKYYKVSDNSVNQHNLEGRPIIYIEDWEETQIIKASDIVNLIDDETLYKISCSTSGFDSDLAVVAMVDVSYQGQNITRGVYFLKESERTYTCELQYSGTLHKISSAYIDAGSNFKTINNESIVGSGNIALQTPLVSGTDIKTINNETVLGAGNINTNYTAGSYITISDRTISVTPPSYLFAYSISNKPEHTYNYCFNANILTNRSTRKDTDFWAFLRELGCTSVGYYYPCSGFYRSTAEAQVELVKGVFYSEETPYSKLCLLTDKNPTGVSVENYYDEQLIISQASGNY